jgi:general secretion pathway protein E
MSILSMPRNTSVVEEFIMKAARNSPSSETRSKPKLPNKPQKKATESLNAKGGPEELIDMPQAIELLKTTRPTFYRWVRSGKIRGMKIGRQWRFYRDDIDQFLRGEAPRIDLPTDISPLIYELRGQLKKLGGVEPLMQADNDVQKALNLMVGIALAARASDIHIGPYMLKDDSEIVATMRLRIDGVLHQFAVIDMRLLPAIMEQWKRMFNCDVREHDKPQDGRTHFRIPRIDSSSDKPDRTIDLRVTFLPSGLGESATLRLLDSSLVTIDLNRINYAPRDKERLLKALHNPWGIIVLSGPTGSGKTTVLYSCLNEVSGPQTKAMSIEDPIEYRLPWVTQVAVNESAGLTFARAMKAVFNSDPDVIMVGEIKDLETLQASQEAALTGHLVLTQFHANEAVNVLKRMVEMGSDPFVVAEATKLVLSQRLVRLLCPECSEPVTIPDNRLEQAAELSRRDGVDWDSIPKNFRKAVGCDQCGYTGFRRRNVIAEVLEVTPEIGKALRENSSVDDLRSIAVGQGMTTMAADGIRRAANGETTLDEVFRILGLGD